MNTVLQQNWQIYAMAVIVGFATVMVMRWWRYRRASGEATVHFCPSFSTT
ncbi:MAG: hypothetical protein WAN94_12785 [Pseudolabrys sp.]